MAERFPISVSPGRSALQAGEYVNAYWTGSSVVAFRRDDRGGLRRDVYPAEHTCFLRAADVDSKLRRLLTASRHVAAIRDEGGWVRVQWRSRDTLRRLTEPGGWFEQLNVETFEADVDPIRRWLTDNRVGISRPRRCFYDLETDSRLPFTRKTEMRVLSWAVVDETGRTWRRLLREDTEEAERELLVELFEVFDQFDQLCAWNSDRFDRPVIEARVELCGMKVELRRWLWLDMLPVFRRFNISSSESGDEKQSLKLDDVATALGLGGKSDFDARRTWEHWERGGRYRRKLLDYNVRDTDLLRQIEEATGYVELLQTVCEVTRCFANTHGAAPLNQVEGYLMQLADADQKFRTHYAAESVTAFAGAYVMQPTRVGILRHVHVCDFASLYPSIILTWNMSPDTLSVDRDASDVWRPTYLSHLPKPVPVVPERHCVAPGTRAIFRTEPTGLVPTALKEILKLRKVYNDLKASCAPGTPEWKDADRRSSAYKIEANSFYGVIGSPMSRFFERAVAESVTQAGAWLIHETIAAAEARGMDAIYADTDSMFVSGVGRAEFASFVDWCNAELYPSKLAELGCVENRIKLDFEKTFDRVIMIRKKRYAGRFAFYKGEPANERSKPEIKGLEYKRGDSNRIARQLQAEVLDLLLGGRVYPIENPRLRVDRCEEDPAVFRSVVERWCDRVLGGELSWREVLVSKRLSRALRAYVRKPKKRTHEVGVVEVVDERDGVLTVRVATASGFEQREIKRSDISPDSEVRRRGDRGVLRLFAWSSLPTHVEVGLMLRERGEDVGEGVRIDYVIVDGERSPNLAAPIADYEAGLVEVDRFHLWENLVYPPTLRVLEVVFPDEDWQRYARVRPKRVRTGDGGRSRRKVRERELLAGRGDLFAALIPDEEAAGDPDGGAGR